MGEHEAAGQKQLEHYGKRGYRRAFRRDIGDNAGNINVHGNLGGHDLVPRGGNDNGQQDHRRVQPIPCQRDRLWRILGALPNRRNTLLRLSLPAAITLDRLNAAAVAHDKPVTQYKRGKRTGHDKRHDRLHAPHQAKGDSCQSENRRYRRNYRDETMLEDANTRVALRNLGHGNGEGLPVRLQKRGDRHHRPNKRDCGDKSEHDKLHIGGFHIVAPYSFSLNTSSNWAFTCCSKTSRAPPEALKASAS